MKQAKKNFAWRLILVYVCTFENTFLKPLREISIFRLDTLTMAGGWKLEKKVHDTIQWTI